MNVSQLSGVLLDCWVACAENPQEKIFKNCDGWTLRWHQKPKPYSTDWAQGGPIIERDQIFLDPPHEVHYNGGPNAGWKRYDQWTATVSARTRTLPLNDTPKALGMPGGVGRGAGETPLIAAMRAKVASHYGDEVPDVP
jgi:hypothetical protein